MKDHLIVIGNGFDLAHGISSSYNHFANHVFSSQLKNPQSYSNLFKIPDGIDSIKAYSSRLMLRIDEIPNNLFHSFIKEIGEKKWSDIEEIYYKNLNSPQVSIKLLNNDFNQIKDALEDFLFSQVSELKKIKSLNYLFNTSEKLNVINFNYTPTAELYTDEENIIHIHGRLKDTRNPIIFGYNATQQQTETLINKNENQLLVNIKGFLYSRRENYERIKEILNNKRKKNLILFGHSCGVSDKGLLSEIIKSGTVDKIYILYYEKFEDYQDKQISISRLTDILLTQKKIVNFQKTYKAPQENWNDNEHQNFMRIVDKMNNER